MTLQKPVTITTVLAALLFAAGCEQEVQKPTEEDVVEEEAMVTQDAIPAPADVAEIPADATVTNDGIGIRVLKAGDGVTFPTLNDEVVVHYTGWTTDGVMFDSSVLRGDPATFPLGGLIPGWQLAIPEMSKGERALIWIPGDLAYDLRPDRPDAPKGMLVFEIELLDVIPGGEGE